MLLQIAPRDISHLTYLKCTNRKLPPYLTV